MDHNYLSGLQSYLEETGVLVSGSEEDIQAAKQEYKKRYQAEYRRKRRTTHPETTVRLTKEEWDRFSEEAKRHHLTLPKFIRQSALAYLNQTYLVPDKQAVARIEQLLSLARTDIQIIAKHMRELNFDALSRAYLSLSERYTHLEKKLSQILREPSL